MMARQDSIKAPTERRCPNCGTRVPVEAASCFMCGYDLRAPVRRQRRISIIDTLLVLAVLAVLAFWWRLGQNQESNLGMTETILPDQIPTLSPMILITATLIATPTPSTSGNVTTQDQTVQRPHIVQKGETLVGIAVKYGVQVDVIKSLNGLQNDVIRDGQQLLIPIIIKVVTDPGNASAGESTFLYAVRTGDTIVSIASRFGSTADDILIANSMAPTDLIKPGQNLRIPVRQLPNEVLISSAGISDTSAAVAAGSEAPPPVLYAAPNLLDPPNNGVRQRAEELLLRWVSVDILAPNEWYVLQIYPAGGSARTLPTVWTKSTSHRLDAQLAPAVGDSATYSWQISIVRVKNGEDGQRILEAASPTSELRKFSWQ